VIHYGGRGAVVVGEIDGRLTPRALAVRDAWRDFDERAIATPNVWGYLWSKLIYGALLFATALSNDSIAHVLADARFRPTLAELGREVARVAAAEGVVLEAFNGFDPDAFRPGGTDEALSRSFDDMVAFNRRSAKSHSGIWRDLAVRKRRTEVDAQLAPTLPIGRRPGLDLPLLARLVDLIHDLERGEAVQGTETLERLAEAMP